MFLSNQKKIHIYFIGFIVLLLGNSAQAQSARLRDSKADCEYVRVPASGLFASGKPLSTFANAGASESMPIYKRPFEMQRQKFRETLLNRPWKDVSRKWLDKLDEQENSLMNEFYGMTERMKYFPDVMLGDAELPEEEQALLAKVYRKEKIGKKDFNEFLTEYEPYYNKRVEATRLKLKKNGQINRRDRKNIQSWLTQFDFNKDDITLCWDHLPLGHPELMGACGNIITLRHEGARYGIKQDARWYQRLRPKERVVNCDGHAVTLLFAMK